MPAQVEYKVIQGISSEIEIQLNELAKDGWKVSHSPAVYNATLYVILERPTGTESFKPFVAQISPATQENQTIFSKPHYYQCT